MESPEYDKTFVVQTAENAVPKELDDINVAGGPRLHKEMWRDVNVNPELSPDYKADVMALHESYRDILTDCVVLLTW